MESTDFVAILVAVCPPVEEALAWGYVAGRTIRKLEPDMLSGGVPDEACKDRERLSASLIGILDSTVANTAPEMWPRGWTGSRPCRAIRQYEG